MYSVSQRAKTYKQPRGGFVNPKSFEEFEIFKFEELYEEENISPSIVGTVVDYMTRFLLFNDKNEAFKISLMGAERINEKELKKAKDLLNSIKGIDDESIINACKLVGYDTVLRAGLMTYKPIEEINPDVEDLTDDPDIAAKLPYVINQILHELARFRKIPAYSIREVEKGQIMNLNDSLDNFYQLKIIKNVDYEFLDDLTVQFLEDGEALITYYQYPDNITETTPDTKTIDMPEDVLEIAPYGIAADILKADVSNKYGVIYANRYKEMIQTLDSRYSTGSVEFEGGIEI